VNDLRREVRLETAADGAGCVRLRAVRVTIASHTEVLVDRRFAEGSCQQRAILAHENEHVRVFREAAAHYAPRIAAALQETPMPAVGATAEGARETYRRAIQSAIAPWLDAIRGRAQEGNDRLDTPEGYARVFRRCPSW
jgi:hypothetical protein